MSKDKATPLLVSGSLFRMKIGQIFWDEKRGDVFLVLSEPKMVSKFANADSQFYDFTVLINGKKIVFSYSDVSKFAQDPTFYLEKIICE